jgi:PilZ domain
MVEKRNLKRRGFSYYMQAVDNVTEQVVGHLADISPRGFRLDCKKEIKPNQQIELRLDLTGDVADKPFMAFVARSKWCKIDELDPFIYNIGFEIVKMSQEDAAIFKRIVEKYGAGQ